MIQATMPGMPGEEEARLPLWEWVRIMEFVIGLSEEERALILEAGTFWMKRDVESAGNSLDELLANVHATIRTMMHRHGVEAGAAS